MIFSFGKFVIDTKAFTLHNDDAVVVVEPQAFDLLVYLIENRQRLVTRDELLDALWQSKVVSDASLSNCINSARKALGDDGHKQQFIKTVHGRGYQFVGDIDAIDTETAAAPKQQESLRKRRKVHQKKLLAAVLGSVAIILFIFAYFSNKIGHQRISNRPIIAVLPIVVDTSNQNLAILLASLSDYLTNRLSSKLDMVVLHPETVLAAQQQFDDVWAIQQATKAKYLVKAQIKISEQPDQANLDVVLYQLQENEELTEVSLGSFNFSYPHTAQDLVAMFRERRLIIKEVVRLIRPGIEIPFTRVETENLHAYQLVIAAHHAQRQDSCQQVERAEQLLRQALSLDNKFSYAWQQLYDNIHRQVWMCGAPATLLEDALAAAMRVDDLTPNRYNSVVQGRSVILTETGRVAQGYNLALDFYNQLETKNDIDANARLAYTLRYAGFLNVAHSYIERILRIEPLAFSNRPIDWTPNTLLYQGERERYLALLANNNSHYHRFYRALAMVQMADRDGATALLNSSNDAQSDDLFARFARALAAILNQQPDLAHVIIVDIATQLHGSGNIDGEMTYKVAQLLSLVGDNKLALAKLSLAVDQGFFCVDYFLKDPAIAPLKQDDEFKRIVEKAIKRHLAFAQRFDLEPQTFEYPR